MKLLQALIGICLLFGIGCIKDDFVNDTVDPVLRITNTVDTLAINTSFQFEAMYLNNVGVAENVPISWTSSAPNIISIDGNGLAQALEAGSATVTAEYNTGNGTLMDAVTVVAGNTTTTTPDTRSGTIVTTSSYQLTGDFTITQNGNDLLIEFSDNYRASTALPGLYVYLTNNQNTTSNALEIGKVQVFSGVHSYTIPNVGINDYGYLLYYCKPFNVKVGDGQIN